LPERIRRNADLTAYDRDTFYTHDSTGYTDYARLGGTSKYATISMRDLNDSARAKL
jgi:hypothetical protein